MNILFFKSRLFQVKEELPKFHIPHAQVVTIGNVVKELLEKKNYDSLGAFDCWVRFRREKINPKTFVRWNQDELQMWVEVQSLQIPSATHRVVRAVNMRFSLKEWTPVWFDSRVSEIVTSENYERIKKEIQLREDLHQPSFPTIDHWRLYRSHHTVDGIKKECYKLMIEIDEKKIISNFFQFPEDLPSKIQILLSVLEKIFIINEKGYPHLGVQCNHISVHKKESAWDARLSPLDLTHCEEPLTRRERLSTSPPEVIAIWSQQGEQAALEYLHNHVADCDMWNFALFAHYLFGWTSHGLPGTSELAVWLQTLIVANPERRPSAKEALTWLICYARKRSIAYHHTLLHRFRFQQAAEQMKTLSLKIDELLLEKTLRFHHSLAFSPRCLSWKVFFNSSTGSGRTLLPPVRDELKMLILSDKPIDSGTYKEVFSAVKISSKTNDPITVKVEQRVCLIFRLDSEGYEKVAKRELMQRRNLDPSGHFPKIEVIGRLPGAVLENVIIEEYFPERSLYRFLTNSPNHGLMRDVPLASALKGVLQGLEYIHSTGQVLCDLTVSNILVRVLGNDRWEAKLCDPGLICRKGTNKYPRGTYCAAPPEAFRAFYRRSVLSEETTYFHEPSYDIFSFGLVVFSCLNLNIEQSFVIPKFCIIQQELAQNAFDKVITFEMLPSLIEQFEMWEKSLSTFMTTRWKSDDHTLGPWLRGLLCTDPAQRLTAKQALEELTELENRLK